MDKLRTESFQKPSGPRTKNIWHSQTHFIDEKIRIFRVRHCFFSGISLLDQVNLTQKRDWDRSHIFLSVLWVYKNNLEATEY